MSLRITYERDGTRAFFDDGKPITEAEAKRRYPDKKGIPRFNRAVDQGWEKENGGRGRYIPQIGDPNDPGCYARSRNQIPDLAKRKGFTCIEKC